MRYLDGDERLTKAH